MATKIKRGHPSPLRVSASPREPSDLAPHTHTIADIVAAALTQGIECGALAPVIADLTHTFTPGPNGTHLYTRQITMPAGAVIVSELHDTCHPFIVSAGRVSVHTQDNRTEHIAAPHQGITTPGTQRLLVIHETTVWTTFHILPDTLTDPEEIRQHITRDLANPLLPSPSPLASISEH